MNAFTQKRWTWFSQALTQHNSFSAYLQPLIQLIAPQWSTDAYRARVVEVRDELTDMYTLVLAPQAGMLDRHWPTFSAGQYIELMVEKNGARVLRCFSISSSPAYYARTGLIELSIRQQHKGKMTPWMRQQLQPQVFVNISAPQGDFTLQASADADKKLFIAGGSGITPFRSMLQQQALNPSSHKAGQNIHLLYYSRNAQDVAFKHELASLQEQHPGITITFIDSSVDGFVCNDHLLKYCADVHQRTAYICGPSPMIQQARKVLSELGLNDDKIYFEYFGAAPIEIEDNQQGVVHFAASQQVLLTEKETTKTLLEHAEEQGLSPVSGCRIGVCHQCICKKKSGVVFNTRTQEFSDTGSEEIQLCISVAQGDVVLDI